MALEFLFGRKKTPDEMLRQNRRALDKAMRELDRERVKMEQQEKKVIIDIKKMAKQGQMVWLCIIKCIIVLVTADCFLFTVPMFGCHMKLFFYWFMSHVFINIYIYKVSSYQ